MEATPDCTCAETLAGYMEKYVDEPQRIKDEMRTKIGSFLALYCKSPKCPLK